MEGTWWPPVGTDGPGLVTRGPDRTGGTVGRQVRPVPGFEADSLARTRAPYTADPGAPPCTAPKPRVPSRSPQSSWPRAPRHAELCPSLRLRGSRDRHQQRRRAEAHLVKCLLDACTSISLLLYSFSSLRMAACGSETGVTKGTEDASSLGDGQ